MSSQTIIGNKIGVTKEQIMQSEFKLPDENENSEMQLKEFYS